MVTVQQNTKQCECVPACLFNVSQVNARSLANPLPSSAQCYNHGRVLEVGDPGRGGLQGTRPRAGQLGGPASRGLSVCSGSRPSPHTTPNLSPLYYVVCIDALLTASK
eukprot:1179224-Prorocentrum_minimum.AAC.1